MFKIGFFCDDKHLSKVMHALNGLALDLAVVPVHNAKVVKEAGQPPFIKAAGKDTQTLRATFLDWVKGQPKGTRLTITAMQDKMESFGGKRGSINTPFMAILLDSKAIKRVSRGVYAVT